MIRVERREYNNIKYLLFYPLNYVEGKKYPVVLHLHGVGHRGDDLDMFNDYHFVNVIKKEDSPLNNCFCVIPQCYEDNWFSIFNPLIELTRYIYNLPFVDQSRFNGSGVSMGGYGIYQLMECIPELFHKAIVCCGGGMYWNAERLRNIKLRIFHGELDDVIYPEESRRMFIKLKEMGADVELTIYPHLNHNCWEATYTNYKNFEWLID